MKHVIFLDLHQESLSRNISFPPCLRGGETYTNAMHYTLWCSDRNSTSVTSPREAFHITHMTGGEYNETGTREGQLRKCRLFPNSTFQRHIETLGLSAILNLKRYCPAKSLMPCSNSLSAENAAKHSKHLAVKSRTWPLNTTELSKRHRRRIDLHHSLGNAFKSHAR